jgi:hypothetical protein
MVTVPFMLLSGFLLPMAMAPGWLDALSRANPFRYIVEAMREAFLGNMRLRWSPKALWCRRRLPWFPLRLGRGPSSKKTFDQALVLVAANYSGRAAKPAAHSNMRESLRPEAASAGDLVS